MTAPWKICGTVLFLVGLVWLYSNYSGQLRRHPERRSDSSIRGRKSKLAVALDEHIVVRKHNEVMREYRRVLERLDEAAGKGFDVRHLKEEMPRALHLLGKGKYRDAKIQLNAVVVRIPRKREEIMIADDGETLEDIFPGITEGLGP